MNGIDDGLSPTGHCAIICRKLAVVMLGSRHEMKTCEYAGVPFERARSHPWTDATGDPQFRYYDLTAAPEHIRTSLEDFHPWRHYAAIDDFYLLLESLNCSRSVLESNDCAFSGPEIHDQSAIPKAFQSSGRVIVLFRELERNTLPNSIEQLKNQLHHELIELDRRFEWGIIGTTLVPARYLALPDFGDNQLVFQLMISFWAWGDTEPDTMTNLKRLFKSLSQALANLSKARLPT